MSVPDPATTDWVPLGGTPAPISPVQIRGKVASGGTIDGGTGFTVVKGGTGIYTINFTSAFAAIPVFIATVVTPTNTAADIVDITTINTSQVVIMIRDNSTSNGAARDRAFHFMATAV